MPYITKGQRALLLSGSPPTTEGELNFLLTTKCLEYIQHNYCDSVNYGVINEVIGALECAKQEFYRRVAIPYEEKKILENGDVYPEQ